MRRIRGAAPVPVEGLDDHVIVLDQLDELEWAGPHRAEGQALSCPSRWCNFGGTIGKSMSRFSKRRVGWRRHQVEGVDRPALPPGRPRPRWRGWVISGWVEHPLEGEANRLGVERLAVVEDDSAAQLELGGSDRRAAFHDSASCGVDAIPSASRPTRESKMPTPTFARMGREIHRGVEILGRPRQRDPQLALVTGRPAENRPTSCRIRRAPGQPERRGASSCRRLHRRGPHHQAR